MRKKVIEYTARVLRKVYRVIGHDFSEMNHTTIPNSDVSEFIYSALSNDKPFMACRFGSTEFCSLQQGFLRNEPFIRRINAFIKGYVDSCFPSSAADSAAMRTLCFYSGFFPSDVNLLDRFYRLMVESMKCVDLLGVWQKEDLFKDYLSKTEFCELGCLEPYDYELPWTKALRGRKVLIVHPFASTIESQYRRREFIWADENVLSEFELHTIKAVQTIAGEKSDFSDWFSALSFMEHQIDAIDFDVAIIGCGAYGFPLAAYIKKIGKKAIHLGGATQILFGIKGKRWDNMSAVSKFYNDSWVYPSTDETPVNNKQVENGCYW